jgi:APA family basic amino acid/polyamine antiporter
MMDRVTAPADQRRLPPALNALGADGCLLLVGTLPGGAVVPGVLMFAIGLADRALARHRPW